MSARAVIPSLPFLSVYSYSPHGACATSRRSRCLRARLKSADAGFLDHCASRARRACEETERLREFLDARLVLVPVPGSAPRRTGAESVTEQLVAALLHHGFGSAMWTGLRRVHAVPRSAAAKPWERPTVHRHYASMEVEAAGDALDQVLLVDDVITKGRTLLAAASRLQTAFPAARIRAFALLRTRGLDPEVERLLDPCLGEIRWRAGDAQRRP